MLQKWVFALFHDHLGPVPIVATRRPSRDFSDVNTQQAKSSFLKVLFKKQRLATSLMYLLVALLEVGMSGEHVVYVSACCRADRRESPIDHGTACPITTRQIFV